MARIAGVDIPGNKRGEIALTYIYGLGRSSAQRILTEAGIDWNKKADEWNDEEAGTIRTLIGENFKVEGVLKSSDISREKVDDARSMFKVGDSVEAKIISVDRKNRGLALSIKAKDYDDEKEAVKTLKETEQESASPGTIGDLIKAQMGDN